MDRFSKVTSAARCGSKSSLEQRREKIEMAGTLMLSWTERPSGPLQNARASPAKIKEEGRKQALLSDRLMRPALVWLQKALEQKNRSKVLLCQVLAAARLVWLQVAVKHKGQSQGPIWVVRPPAALVWLWVVLESIQLASQIKAKLSNSAPKQGRKIQDNSIQKILLIWFAKKWHGAPMILRSEPLLWGKKKGPAMGPNAI